MRSGPESATMRPPSAGPTTNSARLSLVPSSPLTASRLSSSTISTAARRRALADSSLTTEPAISSPSSRPKFSRSASASAPSTKNMTARTLESISSTRRGSKRRLPRPKYRLSPNGASSGAPTKVMPSPIFEIASPARSVASLRFRRTCQYERCSAASVASDVTSDTSASLPGQPRLRSSRLLGDEDRGAGEQPPAQRAPLPPDLLVAGRPLRLHQVEHGEAGRHQFTDPVADGAVLLDVGGRAGLVVLDVRTPVEVRVHGDEAALARVVQEDPAHRVGDREHPAPARLQHPEDLPHDAPGVGNEGHRSERGEGRIEPSSPERQGTRVRLEN